ncbi:MAG: 2-C-methyl-D-erythritol 4-phosphate cytidylyltransferase [Tepidisphaerales bacterium]
MTPFSVVIPAAGKSVRFGGSSNKLFESLAGRSILQRALDPFLARPDVVEIIIPCNDEQAIRKTLGETTDGRIRFCAGGPSRAHSVLAGVRLTRPEVGLVAIHDAARPLLSQEIIDRTLMAAEIRGAAVPAMPVYLTVKEAIGPLPARVLRTIPRQTLWTMQTPQIIRRRALLEAFDCCPLSLDQVTDDVQLIELSGGEVWLVDGEERNLKITTQMDLLLAERLLA